jgi:hypothetical protein
VRSWKVGYKIESDTIMAAATTRRAHFITSRKVMTCRKFWLRGQVPAKVM